MKNAYYVLIGKPKVKRILGRTFVDVKIIFI
jgi:hypothetical protein